jgi:hypothetical protein
LTIGHPPVKASFEIEIIIPCKKVIFITKKSLKCKLYKIIKALKKLMKEKYFFLPLICVFERVGPRRYFRV